MRWSELADKEIINLHDGARLGRVGEADLVFNPDTGEILSLLVPGRGRLAALLGLRPPMAVPWEAVRRVGPEVLIIELEPGRSLRHAPR